MTLYFASWKSSLRYVGALTLLGLSILPLRAQNERDEQVQRVAMLEQIKQSDAQLDTLANVPNGIENLKLPPLQVFLDAVTENATVKRAQSELNEVQNELRLQRRDWWNYIRLNGAYSYGRYNILSSNSDEYTPMYQTSMASAQHNFNVGVSVSIPLGDLTNRKLKLKRYRYDVEQLKYSQEEVMEERRLRVLEAYNQVTIQLATISAKA